MIDGIAGDAFSATTLPPISLEGTVGNEATTIAISRERYATSKKEVEDKIRRWSGMITDEERAELLHRKNVTPRPQAPQPVTPPPRMPRETVPVGNPFAIKPHQRPVPEPVAVETIPEDSRRHVEPSVAEPTVARSADAGPISEKTAHGATATLAEEFERALSAAEKSIPPEDHREDATETPDAAEERVMYPAICDTCGIEIRVPFEPDGKRPTFCKDCFKDHQRALANARDANAQRPDREKTDRRQQSGRQHPDRRMATRRRTEAPAHVPTETPLTLSQSTLVLPKKFRPTKKPPDLGAIRGILRSRGDGG
jgi:CxxC-x17-CxxC domain-containing protein